MSRRAERWLPVPEWPAYEISDRGQVRSVPRVLSSGQPHSGSVLSRRTDRKKYRTVTLADGRRRRTVRVHVLVMAAFAGAPPEGKTQVRHLNGRPGDNRYPENLAWGDQADQEADKATVAARRADRASRRLAEGLNGQKRTKVDRKKAIGERALAVVACRAPKLPQDGVLPAASAVSSQVAVAPPQASVAAGPQVTGSRR